MHKLRVQPQGWDAVRRQRNSLQPGLFLHLGGAAYRHWTTRLPRHTRLEKGPLKVNHFDRDRWRRWLKTLRKALLAVLHFRVFWVTKGGTARYPIAIVGATGNLVLLDPRAGRVARIDEDHPVSPGQVVMREAWSSHVSSPPFEVRQQGTWIDEQFVAGHNMVHLCEAKQATVFRKILNEHTALTQHASGQSMSEFQFLAMEAVQARLNPDLQTMVARITASSHWPEWPLVPAMSDAVSSNLVVRRTLEPCFIDCFPMAMVPFFYPALYFLARSNELPQLRAGYIRGAFDQELEALFSSAQVEFHRDSSFRRALLGFSLCCRTELRGAKVNFQQVETYISTTNWLYQVSDLAHLANVHEH